MVGVTGSIPVAPTTFLPRRKPDLPRVRTILASYAYAPGALSSLPFSLRHFMFRMSTEASIICGRQNDVVGLRFFLLFGLFAAGLTAGAETGAAHAQVALPGGEMPPPLADSTVESGKMLLFDLEARFAKDVRERGGAGFAARFAEDGVSLGNRAEPRIGKAAVTRSSNWSPKDYQLTWTPTGALMGPSGDMGYTWGHFEGRSRGTNGNPAVTRGRYITIWRKGPDGNWKVVLDAGADEPPPADDFRMKPGR